MRTHEEEARRLATALVAAEFYITVEADGEPVDEANTLIRDIDLIVEHMRACEMCEVYCFDDSREYVGWIMWTDCNTPDESICDYTCGPISQRMCDVIEELDAEDNK